MPCNHETHNHEWATEGVVVIERCEKICYFCGKEWKHAWFLRRHVRNVHQKQYPDLLVLEGWTGAPSGNKTPDSSPQRRGRHARTPSVSSGSRTSSINPRTPSAKSVIRRRDSALDFNSSNDDSFAVSTERSHMGDVARKIGKECNADAFNASVERSFTHVATATLKDRNTDAFLTPVDGSCMGNAATAMARDFKYGGLPGPDNTFVNNPDLDLYELFPECLPGEFGATTYFVTPQTVRKDGGFIQAVVPSVEHHHAAATFAEGLNNIVEGVVAGGRLTEEEVLYVLETFAGTFKIGLATPW